MKEFDENKELEQLLQTVEHAGRDARRQQELGDMIDRMAAAEEKHRGFWWWGGRVAAAACLVFFISTAVRVWFIPVDEPDKPMVAAVDTDRQPAVQADDLQPLQPATKAVRRAKPVVHTENQEYTETQEIPEIQETIEEFYAEVPAEETEKEPLMIEQDVAVAPIVEEQPAEPVAVAQTTPVTSSESDAPKPARRSLFGSLFRHAEPSKMDGTVLAINIL